MVDRQIRTLAEHTIRVRNLATFRIPLVLFSIRIPIKLIVIIRRDTLTKVVFDREVRPVNGLIGRIYDTKARFLDFFGSGDDAERNQPTPIQPAEEDINIEYNQAEKERKRAEWENKIFANIIRGGAEYGYTGSGLVGDNGEFGSEGGAVCDAATGPGAADPIKEAVREYCRS